MRAPLFAAVLGIVASAATACRTGDAGTAESSVKDDTTPPPAAVMTGFNKCVSCHPNFKQPGTNVASWTRLVAKANDITPRLDPAAVGTDSVMPPADAPPNKQLAEGERLAMWNAIKVHVTDTTSNPTNLPLNRVHMPAGFHISVYAVAKGARSLALAPDGTLFIGTGGFAYPEKRVYAARDTDGDHVAEQVSIILNNMDNPNGIAFNNGNLYVAERFRVKKYANILSNLSNPGTPQTIWQQPVTNLSNHQWKYIAFGPDGKLYVPVGSPCNICNPETEPQNGGPNKFSRLFRMDANGQNIEVVAKGIRNTVGFDWQPGSGNLWFTDNGRDSLGDNQPPDELNKVSTTGEFFGFLQCHGMGLKDPTYGPQTCTNFQFTKPQVALAPHVAALGMKFYTGSMFPQQYQNQIFVAEHGSWNSTHKVGARLTLAKQGAGGQWTSETFADGWIDTAQDEFWGRPVDVVVAPDGALLVSDDLAGVVYRITYQQP